MAENKPDKKPVTEVVAYARGIHISPRKARLVARSLKQMSVSKALSALNFLTKKAALPIIKLLNSAVANALHNFQIEADRLFVKSLTVDGGRVFFRYQPRAQGRALPVRKRTSHINLILGVRSVAKGEGKKLVPGVKPVVAEKPVAAVESEKPSAVKAEKKSRFSFFGRRGRGVSGKGDSRGKTQTQFDRRAGS